jgi:hypothetical protein
VLVYTNDEGEEKRVAQELRKKESGVGKRLKEKGRHG